jgi:hypothetical protein
MVKGRGPDGVLLPMLRLADRPPNPVSNRAIVTPLSSVVPPSIPPSVLSEPLRSFFVRKRTTSDRREWLLLGRVCVYIPPRFDSPNKTSLIAGCSRRACLALTELSRG